MTIILKRTVIISLASVLLLTACSRSKAFQAKTTTESGVTVVTNPAKPLHAKSALRLTTDRIFEGPVDSFAVAPDGTVFVCEEKAARIKSYTADGRLLESFGTSAVEEGDLERPQIVGLSREGELAVESSGHGKLVFYSGQGRPLRTIALSALNIFRLGIDSRARILIQSYRYVRPNVLYYLRLYDAGLAEIKTYGQYWEPQSVGNDLYAYLPILWWTIDGRDRVVYGYPQRYELKVFSPDGNPTLIVRKENAAVPLSESQKDDYRKEYTKAPYVRIHFPDYHSAFQKFTVDEKGWIYVMTWDTAAGGVAWYDVFDENGIYTARVALNHMPQQWAGERLYTLDRVAGGTSVLTRHRYEWQWK